MPRGPSNEANRNASAGVTTEAPKTEIYRCGKWNLRATESRKTRGQVSPSKPTVYKSKSEVYKRKRSPPPSPQSAASFTASNQDQLEKPQAAKFINKGLPHFDLLNELYGHTQATGAFAQPSTLGAATSDEGANPCGGSGGPDFTIDLETSSGSKGKRKSFGGGSSSVRKPKNESKKKLAWERFAATQKYKQQYYRALATQNTPDDPYSVPTCVNLLQEYKPYVAPHQLVKAVTMFTQGYEVRQAWVAMDHDMRVYWLNSL